MGTPSGSVVAHSWLVCALFACSEPPSENSEPRCPMGARPDEARATRLRARLEGTEAAGYLAAEHRICFTVHGPAVVTDEGDVMLPRDERDDALAARLGHLLEHIVRGTLRNDPAASCDVLVAEALTVGEVDGVDDSENVALAVGEGVSAGVMVAVRLKDVDRDVVKLRVRLTVGEVVGVAAGVIVGLLDEDEVWAVVGDEDGVSMQVGVVVPVEVLLLLNAASALVGTATTTTRKRICAVTRVRRRESVEMTSPLHFILFEGPDEVII